MIYKKVFKLIRVVYNMIKNILKKSGKCDLRWYIVLIAIIAFISAVFLPLLHAGIIVFISVLFILYKLKKK